MDDALQRYIQRALELADQRQEALDEQDLAEIARDLGLTDEDLARVEQAIADHLDRGRGYSDHAMWDDAIREFEEASALAPTRSEVRLELADALTERWAATDFPDDKRRAEELARAVIDREPSNQRAYALLARLNPTSAPAPPPRAPTPEPDAARRRVLIMIAASMVMLLGAVPGLVMLVTRTPEPEVVEVVRSSDARPTPESDDTGELDLPVEFAGSDGLVFKPLRSRLARYPEKAFYTMWGEFEVTADAEFEEIEVSVKLKSESGAVLTHEVNKAWGSHEATLRKGDRAVFTMLVEANRDARSVELAVVRAEREAAKGPYAKPVVVVPKVEVEVADHLQLEIRQRNASFSPMMNGPKGFFEATWEFANIGDVPIRELTYTVTILDADGGQLATKKKLATYNSHPPIGPGEVALQSTIEMIDRPHKSYELAIIELQ